MTYRPGQGTATLVGTAFAVAVTAAVLATFFLFPGGGCNGDACGDASDPTVRAVTDVLPAPGAPEAPGTPGAPAPTGTGSGGDPSADPAARAGGTAGTAADTDPDLWFSTEIGQPSAAPEAPRSASGDVSAMLHAGPLRVLTPAPNPGTGLLTVDRSSGTATGSLTPLLVQDFRGSTTGWSLTATMSDFTGPGGATLDAGRLAWEPRCDAHPGPAAPYPSTAVAGSPVSAGRTALLCSTPSARGVTGGQFDVGADFRLPVPAGSTRSGGYTATLLLTLT
ncbi:WxL domain-containing protein [Yinghuangia sp. ASG 101]|uniref:WxL domain-containing protein n=1 Tax=Yinghuangia sp. ASG 101 TaxID=2896848 RepID=UPI001E575014|nr:WxL domain-containing protein [Yinghuangia sp. ASG 101]UGQ09499.1 WxL domain-containing protein [Yinghuangia sp. ASG 101]